MALKGDLASVDLAQVFQMLALNQKVGLLSIQGPGTWKALYFDPRGVTLYYNEHLLLDRVLDTMVRSGALHVDSVRDARDHSSRTGHTIVETLLAGGYLTEQDIEHSFRTEMEEEIYDLFFWRDARFEFFEHAAAFDGREGVVNERFYFSTDSLIMEAARRIDEWAFIKERITSDNEIFVVEGRRVGAVVDLDDVALSVYELIDGKRNVARLVEVTGLAPFHVYKSLAVLLEDGLIQPLAPDDLVAAAQESVAEGRLKDAINLYERAISLGVGLPKTQSLVAEAYESVQEYELATVHLRNVADYYAQNNEIKRAVSLLRHVIEVMPTDLVARERLVELTVGSPELGDGEFDPVAEGKILVDLYVEIGEIDRVRGILEKLLRDNPDDIELKKSLINVHTKAGDTKRVIELYESIAQDLVKKGSPIEAVKYLQKILMIDRARKDISERIRSLYELDERRRSRRRTLAALGAMILVLAGLGVVWHFYEQHARERFDSLDVSELLENGEFAEAASVYKAFTQNYPLTLVAQDAEAQLARIDSLRLAHAAQLEQKATLSAAEDERRRQKYRREWDLYLKEFQAEDLAAALEHLENVRRMVSELDTRIDREWARKANLDKSLNDLREYIGEAAALDRQARELLAEDKWQEARERLLILADRYELTEVAKRVRIPVLLSSMPPGAEVFRDGKALDLGGERVKTPTLVFCPPKGVQRLQLRHERFQPLDTVIDPRAGARSHHVLTVIPALRVDFADGLNGGVGAGGGIMVASVRGGKIGFTRPNGRQPNVVDLGGLREVVGSPIVAADRVLVVTNEDQLMAYGLRGNELLYATDLPSSPVLPPHVRDGRLVYLGDDGKLVCVDLSSGRTLWAKPAPSDVVARPTIRDRQVHVGSRTGVFVLFDLLDGRELRRFDGLPAINSPVLPGQDFSFFTSVDGRVVALDEASGRLAWEAKVGELLQGAELQRLGDSLFALSERALMRLDVKTGAVTGRFDFEHIAVSGPLAIGNQLFVTLRIAGEKDAKDRDLLVAIDSTEMTAAWEYQDGGVFRGPLATDGLSAYLPGSGTEVVQFK